MAVNFIEFKKKKFFPRVGNISLRVGGNAITIIYIFYFYLSKAILIFLFIFI